MSVLKLATEGLAISRCPYFNNLLHLRYNFLASPWLLSDIKWF